MRLFTFSGIGARFFDVNDGSALRAFALKIIEALPAGFKPAYQGLDDVDHFRSYVNFNVLFADIGGLATLNGSDALNKEAVALSPKYAETMWSATAANLTEDILILCHSQGTNNLTFSLNYLAQHRPEFFSKRTVRCAYFDPKVGANYVRQLFSFDQNEKIKFLFFQSENDILGNQALIMPKFIDQFQHGDHLWVKGLDHSSICEWDSMDASQSLLTLPGYTKFRRDYSKKVIELERKRTKGGLGPNEIMELSAFVSKYPCISAKPTNALLPFLQGSLPKKYQS